jgi:hypothetical protein
MSNYLLDIDFLAKLFNDRNKKTYARLIAINYDEEPLELLEGQVTSGSINVDGASALRRSCSIQLVVQDISLHDYYWGIKNKFKVEIGLENNISNE